ncbi:metalloregulator ArsR/SmtB family transcription factor [Bowmanella dokdonensis]|uniref:Metalloregulator ArsR/SmtB family transcription factor n=1 Tax=Bowmanella dokdonensis TaxID=751969 RepID=A0A939DP89_9ALTE|nr:metalloregulator ArsR/SmtB family transcription factor [Bowmanella dokdonensis]MBN7826267.1 metalloregulator ArsR/SmtB family transcription factor [Bowmanella dokdonensis]
MNPLNLYKCLAEDTRLKSLLLIRHKHQLCVCDLQDALQLSQPKVSRHLAELRKCDLLQDERRGKWVYYRLHPALPDWIHGVLDKTFTHNQDYLADCLSRLSHSCNSNCES